jgi:hypothetical protein
LLGHNIHTAIALQVRDLIANAFLMAKTSSATNHSLDYLPPSEADPGIVNKEGDMANPSYVDSGLSLENLESGASLTHEVNVCILYYILWHVFTNWHI